MTINAFAAGSYVADRNAASLVGLKSRLDTLTRQLSTGRAAETYGGLGLGRTTSLSAHAAISTLDGYAAAVDANATRVQLASAGLAQIQKIGSSVRLNYLNNSQTTTADGANSSIALAKTDFEAVVDALNQQAAGTYVFAGRATDREPVVDSDQILNGDPASGLAGLKDLIAEQTSADLGTAKTGRLTATSSGTSATLSEDGNAGARANFGFSIVSATSSSNTALSATVTNGTDATVDLAFGSQPQVGDRVRIAVLQDDGSQRIVDLTARAAGTPASPDTFEIGASTTASAANLRAQLGAGARIASVQSAASPGLSATFTGGSAAKLDVTVGTPAVGDTLTVTLGMHDGTQTTITLKASNDANSAGSFQIGATAADTATNVSSALTLALKASASTELSASSASRAAQNMFDGSSSLGLAPRRVATGSNGYSEVASSKTVIWYRGDDGSSDPRMDAKVQVGANQTVAIGARANEAPIRATLAGLAAIAVGSFADASGRTNVASFQAAARRSATLLSASSSDGGVAGITGEFSIAYGSMNDAKTQAQATKVTLQNSLDGVENVSTEEVATKLLNLQTQLQASYQVTSMLSKLTLVNYMS